MKGAAEHEGRGNQPESAALLRALDAGLSPELLERALTHRSFAYENGGLPTNERLEFLGDAVLGLIVTDTLFREYPDLPEGHLAKLRAAVVNMRALAERGARAAPGRLRPAGPGRGGHRRPRQVLDPGRHPRGGDRRRLHRAGPGRGGRARAPAVRPGDRPVGPARRRPGLEDLAAGTDRRRRPGRAGVPRRRERPRPPEVLPCAGPGRRARLRLGRGPLQEGSRAAGGRGRLERDQRRAGRRAGGRGRAGG